MTPLRLLGALLLAVPVLAAPSTPAVAADPDVEVEVVRAGLQHPWSLTFLPDGSMLYTQRDARTVTLREPSGTERVVLDRPAGMWNGGETGLMGIERAADFDTSGIFYTCHGYRSGSVKDVRVVAWRLDAARRTATLHRTLVSGLPSSTGRHGGCALQRGSSTSLYVGTGDAAIGVAPQRRTSGGGKVLRISAVTGKGWPGNPWIDSSVAMKRRVYTLGHRNVQGLARHPETGRTWSVEHGSSRDDEVNLLTKKGNYGWNPVPRRKGDPSYNEGSNSPMTDHKISGAQRSAVWSSGSPTVASSGADFLTGSAWGSLENALAVSMLKGSHVRFFVLGSSSSKVARQVRPAALDGTFGRLRGARTGPDGALYLTTSNGSDDKILRVTPR